jgi:hypothetical protein
MKLQDEAVLPVEVQIEIVKGFRVGAVHFVDSLAHLIFYIFLMSTQIITGEERKHIRTYIKKRKEINQSDELRSTTKKKTLQSST